MRLIVYNVLPWLNYQLLTCQTQHSQGLIALSLLAAPKKLRSANRLLLFSSHLKIAGLVKVPINSAGGVLYQGWCLLVKLCCQISTIH